MRSAMRNVLATAAVVLLAASAFAALSPENAAFGKGPAQYFMTADELAKWKTINTDADAKAFIDLFWARRDPTPGTPANEFKTQYEQLVKLADDKFGYRRIPGSMTDRGHTVIVLGPPTEPIKPERIQAAARGSEGLNSADDSESQGMPMPQGNGMRQTWTYDTAKMAKGYQKGLGAGQVSFVFVDQNGSGDFRFERSKANDDQALLAKVAALFITQPNLTSIAQQTTPPVTKQAQAGPMTSLKTAAFQAAVDAAKAGKNDLAKDSAVGYAEFVSPKGDYYVPVNLYVPQSAGLTADSIDTFFGVVEDANGTPVFAFEDPAKLTASKSAFFVDKTLGGNLATGKYTVYLGAAKGGQPVVVSSRPIELAALTADAVGTSRMILSDNIYETTEAAPVKAPFAFGKLKIVPKANLTFGPKDELSYFVEIHNPGIDTATNLPKMQSKLELSGGKLTKGISAPLSDAPALPLSGAVGPGQYAIISSIPLGEMSKPLAPGDYTLKMKLIDGVTKATYNLEQSFKIQ